MEQNEKSIIKSNDRNSDKLRDLMNRNKLVVLILSLGLLMRITLSRILTVHGDEGMYLYDASLILEGLHPHIDFHTRSPVYLYILSSFMFLFGKSVFVGRMVSVLASTITCLYVYKIGKLMFNEKIALIALLIFSFSLIHYPLSLIIKTRRASSPDKRKSGE